MPAWFVIRRRGPNTFGPVESLDLGEDVAERHLRRRDVTVERLDRDAEAQIGQGGELHALGAELDHDGTVGVGEQIGAQPARAGHEPGIGDHRRPEPAGGCGTFG